jgi:hypothetical protein
MTEFRTHLSLLILDIILIDAYSINPDDPFPVLLAKHLQGCVQVCRHRERASIESYLLLWVLTVVAPGMTRLRNTPRQKDRSRYQRYTRLTNRQVESQ